MRAQKKALRLGGVGRAQTKKRDEKILDFPRHKSNGGNDTAVEEAHQVDLALLYAANRFYVYPANDAARLSAPGKDPKKPLVTGWTKGSKDPAVIRNWWRRYPHAWVGLVCGPENDLTVLDIDNKNDKDGDAEIARLEGLHGKLEPVVEVRTPSGGRHLVFRYAEGFKNWRCTFGEIRTKGAGVIAAGNLNYAFLQGSIDDLKNLSEISPWVLQVARPVKQSKKPIKGTLKKARLEALSQKLRDSRDGERNIVLNECAFAAGRFRISKNEAAILKEIALDLPGKEPMTLEGVEATFQSGYNAGCITSNPSEETIATQFAAEHREKRRYCKDFGVWLRWNDEKKIWERDRTGQTFHDIRMSCKSANRSDNPAIGKASTAAGVERFAKADPLLATTSEQWDADPMILGTPGGGLEPHHYVTKSTSVAPAKGFPRLWVKFLHEATNGDNGLIRFLQQLCGYCLTGHTREHALFFIWGDGGNGKSVFHNTVVRILGDYAVTATMDVFTSATGERHSTDIAMMHGARLVAASETEEGRAWRESLLKQLTGGDRVTARFMRQDNFSYIPQFKIVVVSNHKPRLRNVDEAMRRRINIIPFTHKPKNPDKHLEEKLQAEHSQILQWMIDGREDWLKNGLVRPAIVEEATKDYFSEQDLFGQWLSECCEIGRGKIEEASKLYRNWKFYAEAAGELPGHFARFADNLAKRKFVKRKTKKCNFYHGLALKPIGAKH